MPRRPIEIDGLPFLTMVIFHGKLLNNQMVNISKNLDFSRKCVQFSRKQTCGPNRHRNYVEEYPCANEPSRNPLGQ
jgi:hypothetical protein